jgi:pilus assembly protein CpaB
MSLRTVLIGVFALVFGITAAIGVYAISRARSSWQQVEMARVIVLKQNVPRGQTLTADMIDERNWPKESVPEGIVADIALAIGRTVLIPMTKGEPLLDSKLASPGAGRGLAAIIPRGMRAVAIQVPNIATGVAGFILPGNKVDVLMTVSTPGIDDATGGGSTITLLQNVEILAVDQRIEAPQENKMDPKELRSVTLLVTPADAAKLELGQNRGTLHLALRNPGDRVTASIDAATMSGLSAGAAAPPPPVAPPREVAAAPKAPKVALRVRTIRGLQSSAVDFQTYSAAPEELPPEQPASRTRRTPTGIEYTPR